MLFIYHIISISSVECIQQCSLSKQWLESENITSHITISDKSYESNGNETHYYVKPRSVTIVACKNNRNR